MVSAELSTGMAANKSWMMTEDASAGSHSPRVLIADDQPDVLEALRMLLKYDGYHLEIASSPRAVIERLKEAQFDAILIDLNYSLDTTSGTEGMDLLSAIKAVDATVPVIIMTAWATMDIAIEAMRRGACDFIQKPWDNTQVRETVRTQVRHHREESQETRSRLSEIEDARCVQQALLPRSFPNIPGFELAAWNQAARGVGGDYYDVIKIDDNRAALVIADVCGKGVAAALTMSNLQGALKTMLQDEPSPAALCRKLNRLLTANMLEGRFVSLFCAVLHTDSGRLVFCNAGHQPALAVTQARGVVRLVDGGAVLGHFEDWPYEESEIALSSGDSLLLFTDGIVDAENSEGAEFGERGILAAILHGVSDADSIRDAVAGAASAHCEGRFEDDSTLLVLHRR